MRLFTLAVAAMAASAAFSGCLGGDDAPAATKPESLSKGIADAPGAVEQVGETLSQLLASDPVNATVAAPLWNVRDAWTMQMVDGEGGGETTTFVVTAASGSTYTLMPTAAQVAVYDALFDVSYVGPIRASDLAGAQEGTPVKFFDFPLKDGKTWSTTWDGMTVTMAAKANPAISTPRGMQPGFDIVASLEDGTMHATYNYVPAIKWWTTIRFSEGYGGDLVEFKENWTGTVLSPSATEVFRLAPVGPVTNTPGAAFQVAEGTSVLAVTLAGATQQQARAVALVDPAGMVVPLPGGHDVMAEATPRQEWRVDQIESPAPGEWHVALATLHDPEGWFEMAGHSVVLAPVTVA